jgi:septal ring factor EnvC (AmiA/AmiB activator)
VTDEDRERHLRGAVWNASLRQAEHFALTVALICEYHPEVFRAALAQAFDLSQYEEGLRRLRAEFEEQSRRLLEFKQALKDARRRLDDLNADLARLSVETFPVPEGGRP